MNVEAHQLFQRSIDEALVAGESIPLHPVLAEHLRTCAQCEQYLHRSREVIRALQGFTFDVDPSLEAKVFHGIDRRIRQVQSTSLNRRRLFQICCLALIFILLGSVLDLGTARLLELLVPAWRGHLQENILGFWIAPTALVLLVFPMLPLLTRRSGRLA